MCVCVCVSEIHISESVSGIPETHFLKNVEEFYTFMAVQGPCCCTGSSLGVVGRLSPPVAAWASHCGGFPCGRARALL